jgi:hypothetical protein
MLRGRTNGSNVAEPRSRLRRSNWQIPPFLTGNEKSLFAMEFRQG